MTVDQLDSLPALGPLYAKAAIATVAPRGSGDTLPDREVVVSDLGIDTDHLAAYSRVCGFRLRDVVPPTYVHVLGFPLQVELMADRSFPFPLPGLVHVANRIEVHRPVTVADGLELRVRATDLRPHRKGRQFDLRTEALIDGEVVWSGISTYLKRGGGSSEDAPDNEPLLVPPTPDEASATWRVGPDTGRRYGAVSGDRNPIHLHPLPARLFGFTQPIAHGMWAKARCLAALEDRLPDVRDVEVAFKKPLPLPSTVTFAATERDSGWAFAVHDRNGATHLAGAASGREIAR